LPKKGFFKTAFTLIELLIATAILLWVGLGVYRSLGSGISVFKWLTSHRSTGEVAILLDRIAKDARNYCYISNPSFEGSANRISFFVHNADYMLFRDMDAQSDSGVNAIYKVEYTFVPEKKQVKRIVYQFGAEQPRAESLTFSNIEKAGFSFYASDITTDKPARLYVCNGAAPKTIEIEVGVLDSKGKVTEFQKFIDVTIAS
jgi:prepilin-type N-terminal cleavage/methylation domain-containing protein